jgi:hypothetical protein
LRDAFQVLTVIVIALAMAPAVAHALEFPGKRRLGKDAYFTTQRIYYPGFTVVGVTEPLAILFTAVLLFIAERGSVEFWLAVVALAALVAMQGVYWIITHPLNKVWLRGEKVAQAGAKFFALGSPDRDKASGLAWTALRDRWEYSHVARAALALVSLVAVVVAVA